MRTSCTLLSFCLASLAMVAASPIAAPKPIINQLEVIDHEGHSGGIHPIVGSQNSARQLAELAGPLLAALGPLAQGIDEGVQLGITNTQQPRLSTTDTQGSLCEDGEVAAELQDCLLVIFDRP
ncbi:hypothetical protein BKA70DRAFT_1242276 [Coprinopsis sp. MPI-PUGE-AT-0042]|nr:hypothetical protein BKA70DRAFT_1242276 [Coprinopsis sp. MPI-PUGE-AT-0042]